MNKFALFTTINLFGLSAVSTAYPGVTDRAGQREDEPCAVRTHCEPNPAANASQPTLLTLTLKR